MKRGQVTVYIIVGLIALIAVVLTIYVNQENLKRIYEKNILRSTMDPQIIDSIESNIDYCLKDTTEISTKIVTLQGGYFEPKNYFEMESYNVAYWYNKEETIPQITTIEKEIETSISYLLPGCISDFNEDYNTQVKSIIPKVTIKDNKIISSAKINLITEYKDSSYNLDKTYSISYDSELKNIYDNSKAIVDSEKANSDNMDLTFLSNLDYDINFFRFGEVMVYSVSGDELTFTFANRF